jgi:adenylylsulfate kinase
VCNISPFEELRRFAREKIIQYNEIFLKRSLEFSKKVKNMYRENLGKTPIVGIDIGFDEPKNSDLVIDMDKEGIDGAFKRIINYIRKKYPEEFGETYIRDKQ